MTEAAATDTDRRSAWTAQRTGRGLASLECLALNRMATVAAQSSSDFAEALELLDQAAAAAARGQSAVGVAETDWNTAQVLYYARDLVTAHRAARRVEAGYVWINNAGPHFHGAPFGGYKQSGIGREESFDELLEFTQVKNVNVSLDA